MRALRPPQPENRAKNRVQNLPQHKSAENRTKTFAHNIPQSVTPKQNLHFVSPVDVFIENNDLPQSQKWQKSDNFEIAPENTCHGAKKHGFL